MATVQRRIVHKQFNSPIALYSNVNVQETLDRELKQLGNGAVGIDFADPATTRPGSLAKSAVLAALEEEERAQAGSKPGLKRVAWPPPPESSFGAEPVDFNQQQQQQQQQQHLQHQQQHQQHQQTQPQYQPISQQQHQQQVVQAAPVAQQQYAPPPQPQQQQQQRPVSIHGFSSFQNPSKPLSPLPSLQTNFAPQFAPVQQQQQQQQQQYNAAPYHGSSPRGWAHVNSPRSPGGHIVNQPQFQPTAPVSMPAYVQPLTPSQSSYDFGQPQAENVVQYSQPQQQQQQQYQQPQQQQYQQQQPFMGTPLRKEAPVTQKPAPVYQSQPVATTFQGGVNRRGDSKWPPAPYKQQAEVDNEARRQLALGPAFRPRRVNKDFSGFFAQNALQNTYPGYRIPPGTLHIGNGEFL